MASQPAPESGEPIDDVDRAIIAATQEGLPLVSHPYQEVARQLGVSAAEVMDRVRAMQASGVIRRIGAVPNHYRLGYRANGMSVWDVPDDRVQELGRLVGGLESVSHCYQRPRHPPQWPYNLFAMVHGRTREEVAAQVARIAEVLGDADRGHEVLYSTRLLKKTGLRIEPGRS
jgi:DNA-binding Lrp family transcriptional regulator